MDDRGRKNFMNQTLSGEQRDVAARINLWLVDDNEDFRQGFGELLKRRFGFEQIRHFESGESVVEALRHGPGPDALLLDLKLPGMNGVEAVSAIKAKSPRTRVLMFATYFDVACVRQALAGGASAYLTKNQPYEDVVAAVCAEPVAEGNSQKE